MKEWHCVLLDQAQRPFGEDRIGEMAGRGELSPDTLAWSGSTPEDAAKGWRRMEETELAALFARLAPSAGGPETPGAPASPPPLPLARAPGEGLESASRMMRLCGFLIELIVWFLLFLLLVLSGLLGGIPGGEAAGFAALCGALAGLLLYLGASLWGLHRTGQSISKRMLGMRIVSADGGRAPLWRIVLLRNGVFFLLNALGGIINQLHPAGRDISLLICGVFFADACLIFTRDRRTLHDMIAGTIVVKVRSGAQTEGWRPAAVSGEP